MFVQQIPNKVENKLMFNLSRSTIQHTSVLWHTIRRICSPFWGTWDHPRFLSFSCFFAQYLVSFIYVLYTVVYLLILFFSFFAIAFCLFSTYLFECSFCIFCISFKVNVISVWQSDIPFEQSKDSFQRNTDNYMTKTKTYENTKLKQPFPTLKMTLMWSKREPTE